MLQLLIKVCNQLLNLKVMYACKWVLEGMCVFISTHEHIYTYNKVLTSFAVGNEISHNSSPHFTEECYHYNIKSWTWEFKSFIGSISEYSDFKVLLGHSI